MDLFKNARVSANRADGRVYAQSCAECEISAKVIKKSERLSALQVKTTLIPDVPRFKVQSGLPRLDAVEVLIPSTASGDMLAVYQHKDWWHRPDFVSDTKDIPKRTQLLLWRQGGHFHVLLALCGEHFRSDIRGTENGVLVSLSSNHDSLMCCEETVTVHAYGDDPYQLCREAAAFALELTKRPVTMREDKRFPPVFEKLGWCSWDAFYHDVNEQGIIQKLDELQEKQVPVRWALIDDGWSQYTDEIKELIDLDADAAKFPNGLAQFVKTIRDAYDIPDVGVWQAAMGYWNGVQKDSPAHDALREGLRRLPDGRLVPCPDASFTFWSRWHSRLAKDGISFVKVDEQSATSLFFGGEESFGQGSRKMLEGIRASAGLHFGGNLINCMGTASQELWNGAGASLIRSSDDFVPDDPNGFAEHCKQNAYFSLLYGQLYWGDWDMFWSGHADAQRHSILRAVSGGPVYTSDKVGDTDPTYLLPLILEDGTLLRCEGVGMPTPDCLLVNPVTSEAPLKLFNTWGGATIISAFNLWEKEKPVKGRIEFIKPYKPQLLYDRRKEKAVVLQTGESYPIELEPRSAAVYLLIPAEDGLALIGLLDKYLSPAGIDRVVREPGKAIVLLRQGGLFGFWAEMPPDSVLLDGAETSFTDKGGGLYMVDCTASCAKSPVVTLLLHEQKVDSK